MVVIPAICQHLTTYFDVDEYRCWTCSRSLTYPPTTPEEHGALEQAKDQIAAAAWRKRTSGQDPVPAAISCVACQGHGVAGEDRSDNVRCAGCGEALAVIDADGSHQLPPFEPPRLLPCSCCGRKLPQFLFYVDKTRPGREFRFNPCRSCVAVRSRAKREANPEAHRARAKSYSQQLQQEREIGERPPVHGTLTEEQKRRRAASVKRFQARRGGALIPLQRPGRISLYTKPVCRIAHNCPLRQFCTTESKGLA